MATRQPLKALKLSCRTLKHVGAAGRSSSLLSAASAAENAYTRLRIDEQSAGDCALRNDSDDAEEADEENADDEELEHEDAMGDCALWNDSDDAEEADENADDEEEEHEDMAGSVAG